MGESGRWEGTVEIKRVVYWRERQMEESDRWESSGRWEGVVNG